jgi:hypothetical protein
VGSIVGYNGVIVGLNDLDGLIDAGLLDGIADGDEGLDVIGLLVRFDFIRGEEHNDGAIDGCIVSIIQLLLHHDGE